MYTLLPDKNRIKLERDYHARLVIMFLFCLSLGLLVGVFSLVPSYVLSHEEEKRAASEAEALKKDRVDSGIDQVDKDLSRAQTLLDALRDQDGGALLSSLVEAVVSQRGARTIFTSFEVSAESTTTINMEISGITATRDSLIALKKSMTQDPRFIKVDFPVSDLAKNRDIHFTLTIKALWPPAATH